MLMFRIVKAIQAEHAEESKKVLDEVDQNEPTIEGNAQAIDDKIKELGARKDEVVRATENLAKMNAMLASLLESSGKAEAKEDGPFELLRPSNVYQEKWLEKDWKAESINACTLQLKKAFSDKLIDLRTFLECTRKLSTKQFKCLYVKSVLERKYRMVASGQ